MKKILICLGLLLLLASPALAIDASRSGKQIRDEKKQQILERLNNQLNLINDRSTKAMIKHLERIQALLNKIKARVPAVDIATAQAKISEAKTAVEVQAAKEYLIEFSNEPGLRAGASTAKRQLHADLKALREEIRLARQAVVDVLKEAKTL